MLLIKLCVCMHYMLYGIWKVKRARSNNPALQVVSDNLNYLLFPVVRPYRCWTIWQSFYLNQREGYANIAWINQVLIPELSKYIM